MANRSLMLAMVVAATGLLALAAGDAPKAISPSGTMQDALLALSEGRLATAEGLAEEIAAAGGENSWRAWMVVAAARQRMGNFAPAAEAYKQFLASCQNPSERDYALSQIEACKQAAKPAPRPEAPSKKLTKDQLTELAKVQAQQVIETTEHFVVRAYNATLAKLVAKESESSLTRICSEVLQEQDYPHSVEVYIWPDQKSYRDNAPGKSNEWAGGAFTLRQEKTQTVRRIDLMQLDDDLAFDTALLDRVLPHEMCHLVLAEYFGQAKCPLMVNEGLAMMSEAVISSANIVQAGVALGGEKKLGIHELLTMERCDSKNAAVFYAESYSLVSFIHARLTKPQFAEMLTHLKNGCPVDEALQRALCVPADEDFLDRLASTWEDEAVKNAQYLQALEKAQAGGNS